jgi:hypothetical protein
MIHKCADCVNLSSRDVFSGNCEAKDRPVLVDETGCPDFAAARKCKFCVKYEASTQAFLGTCNGEMVYPDLAGCEQFSAL